MLEALRKSTSGIIAKVLLFLLMFSFAIWGVGDMLVGFSRGAVATVGDEQITVEEFQRAEQNALANISQQAGKRITSEQARAAGVPAQVLRGILGQTALKAQAKDLGLDISTEDIVKLIKDDPDFEGPDGRFSNIGFQSFLQQNGLSEAGYVAIRRNDELRQQITNAIQSSTAVPDAQIQAEHEYRNEERTVDHVKIDTSKITVPEAKEEELKAYYETNKLSFQTPEYRKFTAIALTLDDIKKSVEIPEDDMKRSYEDNKDQYDKPERRRVQQIVFKTKQEAEQAKKDITEKGFTKVAEERGLKDSDISLGMVTKKQIFDPKVAEAAFSIERDALSDIIDGRFGPIVLRVIEIEKGEESTFDGVKDKIKDRLATEQARLLIQDRFDLVEEGRNAGKTLKEIADEQKIKFFNIDAAAKDNKTPDDKDAVDHPDSAELLTAVFAAEPGYENPATELTTTEGYAWYNVTDITKPKQKSFEDVKDEVKNAHFEQEKTRALKEFAEKLVERLNNGEAFPEVAKDAGNEPEKTDPPIKRVIQPPGLSKEAVDIAFTLPEGGAGSAESPDRSSRTVFQVTKVTPAEKLSDKDRDALKLELQKALREDYLTTYVAALQNRIGVEINQAEFDRVTGATQQ